MEVYHPSAEVGCEHQQVRSVTLRTWAAASVMPRDRAKQQRVKAMHLTLGEVRGRLKSAAIEVLRTLIEGTFPDRVRRAGANLILRVDHLSVGSIAKRLGWSSIDERDAARMTAAGALTDEARRELAAAKRRVDRSLSQLVAAGIISRTRRAGGRSVTLIELRSPFDPHPPGAAPAAGQEPEPVAPEPVAPVATETSHPSRHNRRTDHDGNVVTGATFSSSLLLSPAPEPSTVLSNPSSSGPVAVCEMMTGADRMAVRQGLIRIGIESGAAQTVAFHPHLTLAMVKSNMQAVKQDPTVKSKAAVLLTRLRRELEICE